MSSCVRVNVVLSRLCFLAVAANHNNNNNKHKCHKSIYNSNITLYKKSGNVYEKNQFRCEIANSFWTFYSRPIFGNKKNIVLAQSVFKMIAV